MSVKSSTPSIEWARMPWPATSRKICAYLLDVLFQNIRNGIGNVGQFSGQVGQCYNFMPDIVLEILHSSAPVIDHHLFLVVSRHDGQLRSTEGMDMGSGIYPRFSVARIEQLEGNSVEGSAKLAARDQKPSVISQQSRTRRKPHRTMFL